MQIIVKSQNEKSNDVFCFLREYSALFIMSHQLLITNANIQRVFKLALLLQIKITPSSGFIKHLSRQTLCLFFKSLNS